MPRRTGRPRTAGDSPTGLGTREDILHAGARLFCTVGYGSTSTHALAEVAGVRQATLYHHFPGKHAVLLELLLGTVQPSLDAARALLRRDEPAPARLWALAAGDVRLLCAGEDNLGALYLLPELDDERFAAFHARRTELEAAYRELVAACGVAPDDVVRTAALVLGLVESVILQRRRSPATLDARTPDAVADAALALVGLEPAHRAAHAAAGRRLTATADVAAG
ncbi:TetR/AcrR family transcriptional regulator [Cellulomonas shaoxiangyii]|uniref:TetR/AcrR family transcriptional regulator n=1 Tax=Cellulomonas shaoxiangyii TaxID=2566013 RepID=A0A4P7SMQ8_9CELL|nr:TetR/AcrR family transcriptional regulator [Cellulomonas shaoxiangyii]QCB94144.1 TetR/AcrR family transcriptional regulator [Cellulomonas shaoxiangyii]TGY86637.1 TetR/AcrR family transcriptional regulator [Cellulomonas shaoxiangyii]